MKTFENEIKTLEEFSEHFNKWAKDDLNLLHIDIYSRNQFADTNDDNSLIKLNRSHFLYFFDFKYKLNLYRIGVALKDEIGILRCFDISGPIDRLFFSDVFSYENWKRVISLIDIREKQLLDSIQYTNDDKTGISINKFFDALFDIEKSIPKENYSINSVFYFNLGPNNFKFNCNCRGDIIKMIGCEYDDKLLFAEINFDDSSLEKIINKIKEICNYK